MASLEVGRRRRARRMRFVARSKLRGWSWGRGMKEERPKIEKEKEIKFKNINKM